MFYYTHILRSKHDGYFYIGFTSNLQQRFAAHNEGAVEATRTRRPFELVYYEAHRNKKDAMAREAFLKTSWGRNYIRRVLGNYLRERR